MAVRSLGSGESPSGRGTVDGIWNRVTVGFLHLCRGQADATDNSCRRHEMKASWLNVVRIAAIVGVLCFGVRYVAMGYGVGDCTNTTVETDLNCDSQGACAPVGICACTRPVDSTDCLYIIWSTSRNYGWCMNGLLDLGCVKCENYYCAEGSGYNHMDLNQQCSGSCGGTILRNWTGSCVPTS